MELRERQDICQDVAISLWQKSILSVEEEYERQQEVLMVGDTCIGTLGNFSASIGKAKSKKTFNLSALVASALTAPRVVLFRPFPGGQTEHSLCGYGAEYLLLPTGNETHPAFGRTARKSR